MSHVLVHYFTPHYYLIGHVPLLPLDMAMLNFNVWYITWPYITTRFFSFFLFTSWPYYIFFIYFCVLRDPTLLLHFSILFVHQLIVHYHLFGHVQLFLYITLLYITAWLTFWYILYSTLPPDWPCAIAIGQSKWSFWHGNTEFWHLTHYFTLC